jgi:hypothetical protein
MVMVIGEKFPWNTLQVLKVDHKSYLQHLVRNDISKRLFQMHFKFKFQTLKMCFLPIDLVYLTSYDSKNDSFNATQCSVKQLL